MVDEKDIEYGKIFHRQLDVIKEQEKLLDHKDSTIKALVSLCLSNGIISRGLACQYLGCGREELDEILDKVATKEKGWNEPCNMLDMYTMWKQMR